MITSIRNTPRVSAQYPTRTTTAFRGRNFSVDNAVSCTAQKNASILSPDIFALILTNLCTFALITLTLKGIKKYRAVQKVSKNLNKLVKTQLPEFIEFKEAKSLQEAIDYTKNVLKIKKVDKSFTLDALNSANKGITDVSNANKGYLCMPPGLKFESLGEKTAAAVVADIRCSDLGTISVNKNLFDPKFLRKDIDKIIYYDNGQKRIKPNKAYNCIINNQGIKFDDKVVSLVEKYYENPESLTIQELRLIRCNLLKWNITCKADYAPIEMIKDIEKSHSLFFKEQNLMIDYYRIKSLPKNEQTKYAELLLGALVENKTPYIRKLELYTPEETMYHEMGHLQDFFEKIKLLIKCRVKFFGRWYKMEQIESMENNNIDLIKKLYPELYEFSNNQEIQEIAGIISEYAQSGIGEFIAEAYELMVKAILSRKPIPQSVSNLYKDYDGPKLVV